MPTSPKLEASAVPMKAEAGPAKGGKPKADATPKGGAVPETKVTSEGAVGAGDAVAEKAAPALLPAVPAAEEESATPSTTPEAKPEADVEVLPEAPSGNEDEGFQVFQEENLCASFMIIDCISGKSRSPSRALRKFVSSSDALIQI